MCWRLEKLSTQPVASQSQSAGQTMSCRQDLPAQTSLHWAFPCSDWVWKPLWVYHCSSKSPLSPATHNQLSLTLYAWWQFWETDCDDKQWISHCTASSSSSCMPSTTETTHREAYSFWSLVSTQACTSPLTILHHSFWWICTCICWNHSAEHLLNRFKLDIASQWYSKDTVTSILYILIHLVKFQMWGKFQTTGFWYPFFTCIGACIAKAEIHSPLQQDSSHSFHHLASAFSVEHPLELVLVYQRVASKVSHTVSLISCLARHKYKSHTGSIIHDWITACDRYRMRAGCYVSCRFRVLPIGFIVTGLWLSWRWSRGGAFALCFAHSYWQRHQARRQRLKLEGAIGKGPKMSYVVRTGQMLAACRSTMPRLFSNSALNCMGHGSHASDNDAEV